ncbi:MULTISPECIES: hypothetical protein [Leisingera]|jgi:hypothetical protein|uniref:hypothetical protein n=1 Tax=Leisingera TaxID=191028 RepID=UPI0021A2B555|nr:MULTISPECIES: hypothetical protein [Leisingera]UWQ39072.1 hypothetical protein K3552_08715 [Leisingera aquaemixtae]
MMIDGRTYSSRERQKIARTARRRVGSEVALVATFGGVVLFVMLFWFGPYVVFPVASALGMTISATGLVLAFGTSISCALLHGLRLKKKVKSAKELDAAFLYSYARKRAEDLESKEYPEQQEARS